MFQDNQFENSQEYNPIYTNAPPMLEEDDQEEQNMAMRAQQRTREKNSQLNDMLEEENQLKIQRRADGKQRLDQMMSDREQEVEKKKASATYQEEYDANNESDNSWSKICNNIALKDGDYQGSKDITKMRGAIVNKREDTLR